MLQKHENVGSVPDLTQYAGCGGSCLCPRPGKQRQGDPWGLEYTLAYPSLTGEFCSHLRFCLKYKSEWLLRNDTDVQTGIIKITVKNKLILCPNEEVLESFCPINNIL